MSKKLFGSDDEDNEQMAETRNKKEAQNIHRTLQDRMTQLGLLQTDWSREESDYRAQSEALISKLRDLQSKFTQQQVAEQSSHIAEVNKRIQIHHDKMNELQETLNEYLGDTDDNADLEDIDSEIEEIKRQIAIEEEAASKSQDIVEDDSDEEAEFENRISKLEGQINEMEQIYQNELAARDEDSRKSTQMMQDLIVQYETAEEEQQHTLAELVKELNGLEKDRADKIASINKSVAESKKQLTAQLRQTVGRLSTIEREISSLQKGHTKQMNELQGEAEALRNTLEMLTARQKQQIKEATATARKYSEEKRAYSMKTKELAMLNNELVREKLEYQNLLKELNKMDDVVLSQMTSRTGSRSASKLWACNILIFSK